MSEIPLNTEAWYGFEDVGKPLKAAVFPASSQEQKSEQIRVGLVDDEQSTHQFLRDVFKRLTRKWTLDSYFDGRNALCQIPQSPPDVILMDMRMPGMSGIVCAKNLKALLPDLPIVIFSAYLDPELLMSSMMTGANGCLYKPAEPADVVLAIQKSMNGSLTLCQKAEKTLLECFHFLGRKYDALEFSPREQEIINCICQQKSDKQISETLKIEPGTVHGHMASIFKKLKVHSRAEAICKIMNVNQWP